LQALCQLAENPRQHVGLGANIHFHPQIALAQLVGGNGDAADIIDQLTESSGELADLVVAVDGQSLVEVTLGDGLGRVGDLQYGPIPLMI